MHFDGREKLPQLFKNRLVGKRSLEIGMTVDDKNFFFIGKSYGCVLIKK